MTTTAEKTWTPAGHSNGFTIYRDRDGFFRAFTGTKWSKFNTLREAQDAMSGF